MTERDPWTVLSQYTDARIARGHCGVSLPTREVLAFRLSHARAADAVMHEPDFDDLSSRFSAVAGNIMRVQSRVGGKDEYLKRPDLGRRLSEDSAAVISRSAEGTSPLICLTLADGLSGLALESHAEAFLRAFLPLIDDLRPRVVCLARYARVALSDEIGQLAGAALSLILIGERPGLSSPDSLGLYMTHSPRVGNTDEKRNCISNIRPGGLAPERAAVKAEWLVRRSLELSLSGVGLKDEQHSGYVPVLLRDTIGS